MKTFRRPLLDPIRNRSGYIAEARQEELDIRDLQRAPVRIPPRQLITVIRRPAPPPTAQPAGEGQWFGDWFGDWFGGAVPEGGTGPGWAGTWFGDWQ